MRLKLKESTQPISKLDYNIQNVVLPTINSYGFNFNTTPLKLSNYEYTFKGDYNSFNRLNLDTDNLEIDVWNDAKDKPFTADIFGTIILRGNKIPLGPLSSKDASTIRDVIETSDVISEIKNSKAPTKEVIKNTELIMPKSDTKEYGPMTKKEWENTLKKIQAEVDAAYKEVDKDLPSNTRKGSEKYEDPTADYEMGGLVQYYDDKQKNPDFEELPSVIAARKALAKYRHFISQIYPL